MRNAAVKVAISVIAPRRRKLDPFQAIAARGEETAAEADSRISPATNPAYQRPPRDSLSLRIAEKFPAAKSAIPAAPRRISTSLGVMS